MAIDTRNKRASVLAAGLAACIAFPAPASPADAPWRVHVAGLYALASVPPPPPPGDPYVEPGGGSPEKKSRLTKGELPPVLPIRRIETDARTPDPGPQPLRMWDRPLQVLPTPLPELPAFPSLVPALPEDLDIIGRIHRDDDEVVELLLNEDLLSPKRQERAALPADDEDALQLILEQIGHQPQ